MNKKFKTGFKYGLSGIFGVAACASLVAAGVGYYDIANSAGTMEELIENTKDTFFIAGGITTGVSAAVLGFWQFMVDDFKPNQAFGAFAATGASVLIGVMAHMGLLLPDVLNNLEQEEEQTIENVEGETQKQVPHRYAVPQPGDY